MVRVKVCGITRVQDAGMAAEAGADMLGFVLEPSSPRFVGGTNLAAECHAVAPYLPFCAVFGDFRPVNLNGFSHVQCYEKPSGGHRWIKVVPVAAGARVEDLTEQAQGSPVVLLDKASPRHGGTGEPIDWGLAAELVVRLPETKVVLAGGLGPDNVAEAIRRVKPYAVDASSRLESAPGIKDPGLVRAFVAEARAAL